MGVELIAFEQVRARCVGREDKNKGPLSGPVFPITVCTKWVLEGFLRLKHAKKAKARHVGTKKPKQTATNIKDMVAIRHTVMVKNGRIKEMD